MPLPIMVEVLAAAGLCMWGEPLLLPAYRHKNIVPLPSRWVQAIALLAMLQEACSWLGV